MVLWAVYSASLRLRPPIHWLSFMFVFALISGIAMLPFWALGDLDRLSCCSRPWLTAFAIVYVTLFSTIAAFVFWTRGVELIGPTAPACSCT